MAGTAGAKRKAQESKLRSRPTKKFKKQKHYSSGSESEAEDTNATTSIDTRKGPVGTSKVARNRDTRKIPPEAEPLASPSKAEDNAVDAPGLEAEEVSTAQSESEAETDTDASTSVQESSRRQKTKRHDPSAFASSINAILSSKLTTSNRKDPVLARSKDAAEASHELAESRLEARARKKLRDEKRILSEKGRVRDVLLGDRRRTPGLSESEAENGFLSDATGTKIKGMSAAEIAEQERRLRKTAQRGVVKLFNAVRAAQVKSEEAAQEAKKKGVVGIKNREEKVGEMGRQAFLDLVGAGKVDGT